MRKLLALSAFSLILVGCGGSTISIPGLLSFRFDNNSTLVTNIDFYLFENSTGFAQTLNSQTPLVTVATNDSETEPFPLVSGTYQLSITSNGSKTPIDTVLVQLDSDDAGTVVVRDNGGVTEIVLP